MNHPATLVACSHGTRSPAASALVSALVDAVADRLPGTDVVEMYVDVQQPELESALPRLSGRAVVVPLFLSAGFHLHQDIHRAANSHPSAVVSAPLGPDPVLTDLLAHRLSDGGWRPGDAVVLAASASSDPRAVHDVRRAARLLSDRIGTEVSVGVVGGAGFQVRDAVAMARRHGRRVAVASYLLMPGHFHGQVVDAGADLTSAPLLAGAPPSALVELIGRRFTDAQLRRAA